MNKNAIVVGSTGLIGKALVAKLCEDVRYQEVKLLVRKPVEPVHSKVEVVMVDFNNITQLEESVVGDELFCCVGTTIGKARSKSKFEEVDYNIPKNLAEIAAKNGLQKFLLISSLGANKSSLNFYLRTKGKAEQAVINSGIDNYIIVRPSLLTGNRNETRVGELVGGAVLTLLKPLLIGPLKRYKPVSDALLSNALIQIANGNFKNRIFESPNYFSGKRNNNPNPSNMIDEDFGF